MARRRNELSATQLNDEVFTWIKQQINRFLPSYLCKLANVSRQTIYVYARRLPVNPTNEREIKRAIKKATELKLESDKREIEEAKKLLQAWLK